MTIRTLIAEDEPLARERIRSLLDEEPDIDVVAECGDGRAAVAAIREHEPDLVFLDVHMPELSGFEVIREVGADAMPPIIFVTAYDHFAVRAFDAHALDYVLKPFDEERFRTAVERARETLRRREPGPGLDRRLADLIEGLQKPRYLERLAVKAGGKIVLLRADEVSWIGAEGNYARLHVGRKSWLMRETMTALEGKLDPARFLRIHRSTIVAADAIAELEPLFQGDYVVVLRDGTRLTSSRGYRTNLQAFMDTSS